ncbi:MAG: flippase-like domain-containing protein [Oscillospiraceae bacterium]
MEEKMGKKRWQSLLFLLLNLAVVGYIFLREFGGGSGEKIALSEFHVLPLLAAVGCFAVMLAAETWKYAHLLRAVRQPAPARTGFACAVLGKYFDNLTPAGAGGQPFQMLYLKRHGCPDGVSGALPVLGFLGLQLSFVAVALVCFIFGPPVDNPALRLTSYFGLCVYSVVPVCILLLSAMPGALKRFIRWGTGCLCRLRLVRDAEAAAGKAVSVLDSYRESLLYLKGQPGQLMAVAVSSLSFRIALLAMPYFVLRAFGAAVEFWPCFCRVAYIYAAITLIPTPGNSGAAEASFYAVFSALSPGAAFWAMLVWRLLCYYSWLIGGAVYSLIKMLGGVKALTEGREEPVTAYFIDTYFPHIDGVVHTVHAYAERLPGSCVLCPECGQNADDTLPYEVLRVPSIPCPGLAYSIPLPGLSRQAKRFLKEKRFAVFHAHSPFTMGHFALRMGKRLGVPVVATFHSKYYDDVLAIYHSEWLAKAVTRYIVRFYRRVDEVWACSASTAETLRSYGYEGEIRVMENGTETAAMVPSEGERRKAARCFRLSPDCPVLLFVGQQIWQKNLKLVLDTCEELKRRGFAFRMLVVGCGCDAEAIREYAAGHGLMDVVSFVGVVRDRSLLRGLYMASSLLFFPSLYDNAPLVVREAAALGVPSLLAKGSNAAECITDGENGFEAACTREQMADKIMEVFDRNAVEEVGMNAMKTIPIPWETITARAAAAYADLHKRAETYAG